MSNKRTYVRHRWIATGKDGRNAYCFVCGITEKVFEKRIETAPMIEWDCVAVQAKEKWIANEKKKLKSGMPMTKGCMSCKLGDKSKIHSKKNCPGFS